MRVLALPKIVSDGDCMRIYKNFGAGNKITLFNGDCIKLLALCPDPPENIRCAGLLE